VSSYKRLIFFTIFIIFGSCGCAQQSLTSKFKNDYRVDLNMLVALDSESQHNYPQAYVYYKSLFNMEPKELYIKKMISFAFLAGDYLNMIDLATKAKKLYKTNSSYYKKQITIAYIKLKKYPQALTIALDLVKDQPTVINYEVVANVYYMMEEYKNAIKYYESSYAQDQNSQTLLKLTSILYGYLNQKDVALAYLETYLQQNGCKSKEVCEKLLLIYQEQGNIDGMLSILKRMLNRYKQDSKYDSVVTLINNNIVTLLEQKDIKKAIEFLEKTNSDQNKLLNLYHKDGQLIKALKLVRKIYRKTKDPELLGKIAMYQFESANDKKKILKHVIANFELALSSGINNPSYQNYYGYILIEYDLDVKKGVDLVEQALKSAPNNLAYLDSLAWGYYKLGLCEEAKDIINRVIQQTGLNDKDIKKHWDKINNCKGKKQ